MIFIIKEIKKQIKLKQALINTLEVPIKECAYIRSKEDIERKKKSLQEEIEELKRQLKERNSF